jgi:hypothetical protein
MPWPLDLFPHVTIRVNQDLFCGLGDTPNFSKQLSTLFHEFMHLDIPKHDSDQEIAPNRANVDQIYACQELCFKPHNAVTQCSCATCIGTTKCDPRCSTNPPLGFLTCSNDFGAWCPCPTRLKWYPTCSDCLVGCPSGLFCGGYHFCLPVNKGRCMLTTCP